MKSLGNKKSLILKLILACVLVFLVALGYLYFALVNKRSVKPVISASSYSGAAKILFIGNSLTFVNMLPAVLHEFIVFGLHKPTKICQIVAPAQGLHGHWNNGIAQQYIERYGPWDFVVLQGGSLEPLGDRKPDLFTFAKQFDQFIKTKHLKTILFETWADKSQSEVQNTITETYKQLGAALDAPIIPVGEAFFAAQERDHNLNCYSVDNHHPSQMGTYLAACLFYAYLFDKDPHGLPAKIIYHDAETFSDVKLIDLELDKAAELQDIGWDFYTKNRSSVKSNIQHQ